VWCKKWSKSDWLLALLGIRLHRKNSDSLRGDYATLLLPLFWFHKYNPAGLAHSALIFVVVHSHVKKNQLLRLLTCVGLYSVRETLAHVSALETLAHVSATSALYCQRQWWIAEVITVCWIFKEVVCRIRR